MILLVHPPVVKPSEPPAGIGRLCGALRRRGVSVSVLDANLEGLLCLLGNPGAFGRYDQDRWTVRAARNLNSHLQSLRSLETYRNPGCYRRAVSDLGRLLEKNTFSDVHVGLANFRHDRFLPVKSADLLRAAQRPEENPFYPWFGARLRQCLETDAKPFIGFSLNYLSQAVTSFAMMGFLKKSFPGVRLIIGGGLVTSWLSSPDWRNPFGGLVDHVIGGPGEGPLLSLLSSPRSSSPRLQPARDSRMRGAAGNEGEKESACHAAPDYSDFPLPDYLAPGIILPYSASLGCYWRKCLFCPERAEGNPYLPLPAEKVASDLATLTARVRTVLIHLLDNALSPGLLGEIVKHPPGAPWYGFARIEEHLADEGFCRALKRSGCAMVKLGLESGDQEVLNRLEKGVDIRTASLVLKTLRRTGIPAYVYLLFGTPAEDEESARRTLDFVTAHGDCIDFLNVAVFNLPVFASSAAKLATRDFYEGDLSLYRDFVHPRGWSRAKVRAFLDKEFRRHPAVAPILRNDPPVFTSNHAPFFTPVSL